MIVEPTSQRPRLAIIQTGGTIGSRPDDGGDLRPDKRMLTDRISDLSPFEIEVHQPFTLPSPHITPSDMHHLREVVHEVADRVQGIVITHGTDTLEETAFYLHLTVQTDTPVVLTGSMRHSRELSWDGPFNVWAASHVAMHRFSKGRGALVVFGGDIFDARTVTKVHTTALEAFGGYPGAIGRIDSLEGEPSLRYFARPEQRYPLDPPNASPNVEILTAYAGWRGEGLQEALDRSDGVVIAALGAGNLPPYLVPIIAGTQKPVVIATRTDIGPILPIYGYEGGGRTLYAAGAIPASFLNAFKARIKLIILLSLGYSRERVAATFTAERSAVAP
jgi:L-asparaginase